MCKRLASVLLLAGILSACGGGGSGGGVIGDSCSGGDTPGAGSAGAHGTTTRTPDEVRVSSEDGQFVARQHVTLTNDFGGASKASVTLSTANGGVGSCAGGSGGYRIVVTLEGKGATEAEARAALQSMTVNHSDSLSNGTLTLSTGVAFANSDGGGLPLPGGGGTSNLRRGATISAVLPGGADYALNQTTSNGNTVAGGLSGAQATLTSSNGNIGFNGRWNTVKLDTSDGVIELDGDFAKLDAVTTNGVVDASLATARSTDATLSSSNGPVFVELRRSGDPAFDLTATTSNGNARIEVGGTEPVGNQQPGSAHRQTPGFASHAVQVSVSASTSNGNAEIHD